jgi:hypothetical protein
MAGNFQPELLVYTEDLFAAVLVGETMSSNQRARIQICDVGSNATLARQAVAHARIQGSLCAFAVFDGDCSQAQVDAWIRDERGERSDLLPTYLILPDGRQSPERWVLEQLTLDEYRDEFARELNCTSGEASAHIQAMAVQLDGHDASFVLAQRTGLDFEDARRRLIRSVARRHPQLDPLRAQINDILDGAFFGRVSGRPQDRN